eukprot:753860_1
MGCFEKEMIVICGIPSMADCIPSMADCIHDYRAIAVVCSIIFGVVHRMSSYVIVSRPQAHQHLPQKKDHPKHEAGQTPEPPTAKRRSATKAPPKRRPQKKQRHQRTAKKKK